ncbi:hypothetical protein EIP86_007270 [Pleurotus ostreatoroseus]|nr:hypothetical protein EIP86_007270 [Pleurotus ostreatoroseus]
MHSPRRTYTARTSQINRIKLMSSRVPVTISCLCNVQENFSSVMKTLKGLQDVGLYAQSDSSAAFVSPATIRNVSRGLLTIAMNAIYLQTKTRHNANDTLKLSHEENFLGLDPYAYIPVALSEAFLYGLSDEYKHRAEFKRRPARGASRGASRGGRASRAAPRGRRAPASRPPTLSWNPSSRAAGPSATRNTCSPRGTPSPRGSRGASHSRVLRHASSSRVAPASVSEDNSDSVRPNVGASLPTMATLGPKTTRATGPKTP